MRNIIGLLLIFAATPAAAHPGHVIEIAGHGHLIGAAAAGAAILIGIWAGLRGGKEDAAEEELETEETPQEA